MLCHHCVAVGAGERQTVSCLHSMPILLRAILTFVLSAVACTHATRASRPDIRTLSYGDRDIETTSALRDDAVLQLARALEARGTRLTAVWEIPGNAELVLSIIIPPEEPAAYGPQLAVLRPSASGVDIVHASARLLDDDFINPSFFTFHDRTLVLADHGSEDAYGIIAWSIESGTVRPVGEIPVAFPEGDDVFTRGAASSATAKVVGSGYEIEIPGPLLLNPRSRNETVIAGRNEAVTFCEASGALILCRTRS